MLVLTRNYREKVILTLEDGRTIEVLVVDIDRGKIRLGFVAPPTVKIHRAELLEASNERPSQDRKPQTPGTVSSPAGKP